MALKMMGSCMLFLFVFLVEGVFGDAAEVKSVEGDLVTLNTDDIKKQHDTVRWYFNGTLIAVINGNASTSCLYDGVGGRFRDRLKVDYETGFLNITNITTEHTGRYEAELYRSEGSGKRQNLNRTSKCNSTKIIHKSSIFVSKISKSFSLTVSAVPGSGLSPAVPGSGLSPAVPGSGLSSAVPGSGLSPAAVAGVVGVAVAAVALVGVIYFHRRRSRNDMKKNKQVLELVSMDEKQNEERHMI